MLGGSGAYASFPEEKLGKCGAVWCVLVYILIKFLYETYFHIKNNSYIHIGTRLL